MTSSPLSLQLSELAEGDLGELEALVNPPEAPEEFDAMVQRTGLLFQNAISMVCYGPSGELRERNRAGR